MVYCVKWIKGESEEQKEGTKRGREEERKERGEIINYKEKARSRNSERRNEWQHRANTKIN